MASDSKTASFWFDPLCPYAWITSRWLLEVAAIRPVAPEWHVMSLAVINEHRDDLDEGDRAWFARAWMPVRVVAAAEKAQGNEVVLPLYTAIGERIHPGKRGRDEEDLLAVLAEALAEVGLPADLIDAAKDEHFDIAVRRSTADAMSLVGNDVGTPVLGVDDWGIYGPIMTRIPRSEDAAKVWDATLMLAGQSDFWELKRTRGARPQFD